MVTKQTAKAMVKKAIVVKEAFNKSTLIKSLVEATCLPKKEVEAVMCTLTQIIEAHISKKGPGLFVLPGIAKFRVIKKPATKARSGKNPFTGEPMTFKAKPATNVVKIRSLKKLKDIAK